MVQEKKGVEKNQLVQGMYTLPLSHQEIRNNPSSGRHNETRHCEVRRKRLLLDFLEKPFGKLAGFRIKVRSDLEVPDRVLLMAAADFYTKNRFHLG